jgi:hypothetical protein
MGSRQQRHVFLGKKKQEPYSELSLPGHRGPETAQAAKGMWMSGAIYIKGKWQDIDQISFTSRE